MTPGDGSSGDRENPPPGRRPHHRSEEGTFDRRYERVARWCLDHGIRPNHLTFLQVPVFTGMVWAALTGEPWWFFGLSWFVVLLDGGDGILARVGGMQSRAGALLDAGMDTVGIAVVMWGASRFFLDWAAWVLAGLFVLNLLLYGQNQILGEKVVSYVRGPVIVPIVVPDMLYVGLGMAGLIGLWLLAWRVPGTVRALASRTVGAPPSP